ncbi:response regulator transcription factor [Haloferula sargassicola]|uniref:Transcriptional regulatory protein DegU n=1 Tax=Haloferula sargassicola TaxID=490096 RepID=A0ABP9UK77_9BACT
MDPEKHIQDPPDKPRLHVAVIEDDKVIRSLISKRIGVRGDMELAAAWTDAEGALAEARDLRPDVIVVDLELPGMSGAELIRTLSEALPCTAFLVLTVHDDPERVFEAIRAGANGYLLKESALASLADSIVTAHLGGSPLSPEIAGLVIRAFQKTDPPKPSMPLPSLAPREREVLELLATGMAPKEAAADLGISYETVRDYLKHIYQKLHVRSRTEAVLRFLEATS